jgi:hypothetical protein
MMATNKVVVGGSNVSAAQLKDFFRQIEDGSLKSYHIQCVLDHQNPFEILMDTQNQLERACALYAEVFGITIDPVSVVIPERQPGRDRLIVIPKSVTMNRVVEYLRTEFTVSLYTEDLDRDVTTNDRTSSETYAIWVQDVVEADEELKGLSANDLAAKKIPGVTLLERLLHEMLYFKETGKHLDLVNWTLCSGSRYSVGHVPLVDWREDDRCLRVNWDYPDFRNENLRSRAVVS